jgi:predicted nucleotidyltransferase
MIVSKKFIDDLVKKFNLKLFILFGSRAKNVHRSDSDWDFAYLPKKKLSLKKRWEFLNLLSDKFKTENIDLIDISEPKNYLILKNIFFEGKCLYEEKEDYFKDKLLDSWFAYEDFKQYYDIEQKIVKDKLKNMVAENGL